MRVSNHMSHGVGVPRPNQAGWGPHRPPARPSCKRHLPPQARELLLPLAVALARRVELLSQHQAVLGQLTAPQPVALTQRQQARPHDALRGATGGSGWWWHVAG